MSNKRVKYDKIRGNEIGVTDPIEVAASEVFKLVGGKFVKKDGSNQLAVAGSGDTEIEGWALAGGDLTASSTAGVTKLPVDTSYESVFEIPIDATQTLAQLKALLFKTCDLVVTSNVQYADIGENNESVIQIVGYDFNRQTVYVKRNPNKSAATGVV